jgi:predicted NAD-dependent protein-ADP-ribosyltransferase YbiA (DUF1768 family)
MGFVPSPAPAPGPLTHLRSPRSNTSPLLTASPLPLPIPAPYGMGDSSEETSPLAFDRHVYPHLTRKFELASPHPIVYHGQVYPTAAHLLESLKFTHDDVRDGGGPEFDDLRERVRTCETVDEVREFVAGAQSWVRGDWEDVIFTKLDEVVMLKVQQHSDVRKLLLGTGHHELLYAEQEEMFWGGGETGGRNELGKALMRARERLREARESGRF